MTTHLKKDSAVLYLAVVPFYRQQCIDVLRAAMSDRLVILTGDRHCDATVRTGIRPEQYISVRNRFIAGRRLLLQTGHWRQALRADVTILDLNPRSLTTWMLAAMRRIMGRRTLLWGHLHPRAGAAARTNGLRQILRRVGHGTVLYGYDSVLPALQAVPGQPVWVAPNALFRRAELGQAGTVDGRSTVLYVGRLEPAKRVDELLQAFASSGLADTPANLEIVGTGSMAAELKEMAAQLGCAHSVRFHGQVTDPQALRRIYDRTAIAVSPGYAGLSLTQALGFGVPMLVSENEPHAPEIELARFGYVRFYNGQAELIRAMVDSYNERQPPPEDVRQPVVDHYTAEDMAAGLHCAFEGRSQDLDPTTGWPRLRLTENGDAA